MGKLGLLIILNYVPSIQTLIKKKKYTNMSVLNSLDYSVTIKVEIFNEFLHRTCLIEFSPLKKS